MLRFSNILTNLAHRPLNQARNATLYVPVIGLEVHAQLKLKSKLFSEGGVSSKAAPNTQCDLLDLAIPGTLPTVNKDAIQAAIVSSLALNCSISDEIHFDRKNYFYSDMPAGFQITQHNKPLATNGYIDFIVTSYHKSYVAHTQQYDIVKFLFMDSRVDFELDKNYIKRSRIKQVQLEQDSAKTLHQSNDKNNSGYDLVDYNRCGSSLIEIVFDPDLNSAHEASSLVKELIAVLRTIGTCDCELQEGSLRVDANVSIHSIDGIEIEKERAGRVELKNLNSIKALNRAIANEIQRQVSLLEAGGKVVQQTRTYDARSKNNKVLRLKETTIDYRYVPEPSIPPLVIDHKLIENCQASLPKLPCDIRQQLIDEYNLDLVLVSEIVEEPGLSDLLLDILAARPEYSANHTADFLVYTIGNLRDLQFVGVNIDLSNKSNEFMQRLNAARLIELFDLMHAKEISYANAFEIVKYLYINEYSSEIRKLVEDLNMLQINDEAEVNKICDEIIQGMKNISKKYSKTGDKRFLRYMLQKICDEHKNKVCIELAAYCLESKLRPPPLAS